MVRTQHSFAVTDSCRATRSSRLFFGESGTHTRNFQRSFLPCLFVETLEKTDRALLDQEQEVMRVTMSKALRDVCHRNRHGRCHSHVCISMYLYLFVYTTHVCPDTASQTSR